MKFDCLRLFKKFLLQLSVTSFRHFKRVKVPRSVKIWKKVIKSHEKVMKFYLLEVYEPYTHIVMVVHKWEANTLCICGTAIVHLPTNIPEHGLEKPVKFLERSWDFSDSEKSGGTISTKTISCVHSSSWE